MKTLSQVLDTAKSRGQFTSDRKLAEALGVTHSSVNFYRHKHVLPDDETMIRLAKLADIEPNAALLMLNIWRAKGAESRGVYKSMLAKIGGTAAAALIALGVSNALPSQADAATVDKSGAPALNIMRHNDHSETSPSGPATSLRPSWAALTPAGKRELSASWSRST